jgi:hypothetical protein
MTIDETNSLLEINNEKIKDLQKKIKAKNEYKYERFTELKNLILELTTSEKLYYDYRTLLAFSYPEELDDENWVKIDAIMPSLAEHIKTLRQKLEEFKLEE